MLLCLCSLATVLKHDFQLWELAATHNAVVARSQQDHMYHVIVNPFLDKQTATHCIYIKCRTHAHTHCRGRLRRCALSCSRPSNWCTRRPPWNTSTSPSLPEREAPVSSSPDPPPSPQSPPSCMRKGRPAPPNWPRPQAVRGGDSQNVPHSTDTFCAYSGRGNAP